MHGKAQGDILALVWGPLDLLDYLLAWIFGYHMTALIWERGEPGWERGHHEKGHNLKTGNGTGRVFKKQVQK